MLLDILVQFVLFLEMERWIIPTYEEFLETPALLSPLLPLQTTSTFLPFSFSAEGLGSYFIEKIDAVAGENMSSFPRHICEPRHLSLCCQLSLLDVVCAAIQSQHFRPVVIFALGASPVFSSSLIICINL